ncbi:MAG: hypothetical protein ACRCRW_00500 [Aeromonadaceae bacterium]
MKQPIQTPTATARRSPHAARPGNDAPSSLPMPTPGRAPRHSQPHLTLAAFILAMGMILAALISQLGNGLHWFVPDNTLQLANGKVKLGDVYAEHLTSTLVISRVTDNGELLRVESSPAELYPQAVEKVLQYIQLINERASKDNSGSYTPVQFESAMWSSDVRIKLQTTIEYQSQYQPQFRFVMESSDRIVKKDKASIKPILDSMQDYGKQALATYQARYSFISTQK